MYSTKSANKFVFSLTLVSLFGALFIGILIGLIEASGQEVTLSFTMNIILSQVVFLFFPSMIYLFLTNKKPKEALLFYKVTPLTLLLVFFLTFLLIPFTGLINLFSQLFFVNRSAAIFTGLGDMNFLVSLLFIAVFPAVFEEIATRGLIISNYREKSFLITCVMSGLFFGLIHLNMNQFMYAFFLGFIFAFVVHITGSIFPSMVMHFTNNAFSLILQKTLTRNEELSTQLQEAATTKLTSAQMTSSFLGLLGMAVLATPFIVLIFNALISKRNNYEKIMRNAKTKEFFPALTSFEAENKVLDKNLLATIFIFIVYVLLEEILPALGVF